MTSITTANASAFWRAWRPWAFLAPLAILLALALPAPQARAQACATVCVTGLSVTHGTSGGGTTVIISGTGFTGATRVGFDSGGSNLTAATSFTVNSDTQITAVSPRHFPGFATVTVTTAVGTSASTAGSDFQFDQPSTLSITPTSGPAAGGTLVTVTGTSLSFVNKVDFGSGHATNVTVVSDTQVTAISPAGSGTVTVAAGIAAAGLSLESLSSPEGVGGVAPAVTFTYLSGPAVTAVSPSQGPAAGGTAVTITGSGLTGATAVHFGAATATSFTVNSDTSITATAPAGAAGTVDVTVTTAAGTTATTAADQFTYLALPTLTGLSPTAGPLAGGTTVTLTGTGLTGATSVSFGGTPATSFTVNSATSITAVAPAHAAGSVSVQVTTAGGLSVGGAGSAYTYTAAPTTSGVSPGNGPTGGGTSVTISGSGFTGATAVSFGGTAATSFTVNSDTSITAVAPAHAAGAVSVLVTTAGGVSSGVGGGFTYLSAPNSTGLSPNNGPVGGGTTVTITGTGFTGATGVSFGGTAATSFTVVSDSTITAVAPAHAAGGVTVLVTTAGGTSVGGEGALFTYNALPTVTGISPATGAAGGGTSVTITGTGFTGATAVRFGTTNATSFTVNSATSITATSPAGTGAPHVTVATPNGTTATSAADVFTYTGVLPVAGPAQTVNVAADTSGSADLNTGATGGPFTGAAVVSVAAPASGTASISTGANGHLILGFTPAPHFSGNAVVTYTISNSFGASAPATVTFVVAARPDPSLDPDVRGLLDAQAQAAIRFGETQLDNFNQRLEQMHRAGPGAAGGVSNGLTFGLGGGQTDDPNLMLRPNRDFDPLVFDGPGVRLAAAADQAGPGRGKLRARGGADQPASVSVWTGGALDFGMRGGRNGHSGFKFSTSGISLGLDHWVSDRFAWGAGLGYGQDGSKIGSAGTRSDARSYVGVVYASWRLGEHSFLDGVAGGGQLHYDSRRAIAGTSTFANGRRNGSELFGSLTATLEGRHGSLYLAEYGRLDVVDATLDAFTETTGGVAALAYDRQSIRSLKGALGMHGDWASGGSEGMFVPHFRVEYQHSFQGAGDARLQYADWLTGPVYVTNTDAAEHDQLMVGFGGTLRQDRLSISLDYGALVSGGADRSQQVTARAAWRF